MISEGVGMTSETTTSTPIVRAPFFPIYRELKDAMRAFEGEPVKLVQETIKAIFEQTGTPENPVDWSEPDKWIDQRLSGDSRRIAHKIWVGSSKRLNPRHSYGCYLFINKVKLLDQDGGNYQLNETGKLFLKDDEAALRHLDEMEGLPKVLSLVAEQSPCKRGDILPAWSDYLKAVSLFKTSSTFKETLYRRLTNLVDRRLISRDGNTYSINDPGLLWLKGFSSPPGGASSSAIPSTKRTAVAEAQRAFNDEQLGNLCISFRFPSQFDFCKMPLHLWGRS